MSRTRKPSVRAKPTKRAAAPRRELQAWRATVRAETLRRFGRIRAKYEAAQTTAEYTKHWKDADFLGPREANRRDVRRKLTSRARYERDNNSYCHGMVSTLAMDCIGTGPRFRLLTASEAVNQLINREFAFWCEAVDLAGKLRLLDMCAIVDGEGFALFVDNPLIQRMTARVGLDLRVIECDYVTDSRVNLLDKSRNIDGIEFDQHGNPKRYRVLREHPGDGASLMGGDAADWLDANAVLHWFKPTRAGQARGIPEFTPSLPLFAQLRRYTLAVLMNAELVAEMVAFIQTNLPPGSEADTATTEAMDEFEIVRGMITTLPAGWQVNQINPTQPTTGYGEFVDRILREIARCLDMPWGLASGDSSQYNYASGRLDIQVYVRRINVRRRALERLLNRIFMAWLEEAMTIPGYLDLTGLPPVAEWRWAWHWDGFGHVDPNKEAGALQTLLQLNAISITEWCAINGRDAVEVMQQIAKDNEQMRKLGILPPERPANPAADVRVAKPTPAPANAEEVPIASAS